VGEEYYYFPPSGRLCYVLKTTRTDQSGTCHKLFARAYGGKGDKDINVHNEHTVTKLKMVSLYDFMLDPFKN
jgi:hypothetical protein